MTCEEIKQAILNGARLIDVRTDREFAAARIIGAINLPIDKMDDIERVATREDLILLYCQTGRRSEAAMDYLDGLGYNVYNIGGISQFMQCIEY